MLACRRTGGGSGYPVASASLSRSRPGVGGPAGAPNALNELDPLPQARYASGVDATGYPRSGDPPPSLRVLDPSRSRGPPEARQRLVSVWRVISSAEAAHRRPQCERLAMVISARGSVVMGARTRPAPMLAPGRFAVGARVCLTVIP